MKHVKIYLQLAIIVPFLLLFSCKKSANYIYSEPTFSWTNPIIEVNGFQLVFSPIEGNTFYMGAQSTDPQGVNYDSLAGDDTPVHIEFVQSFYLCQSEVTQGLWESVMGSNPSYFNYGNPYYPVESVSYEEVIEFIKKLSEMTNYVFRLPTEAEWEYAARGGRLGDLNHELEKEAWIKSNSDETTHPVQKKFMNNVGIFDMKGNVWEFCSNSYESYGRSDTIVTRGGSWNDDASRANVFYRGHYADPTYNDIYTGFRLAISANNYNKWL